MDFRTLSLKEKKQFSELLFSKLNNANELKDWVRLFLGLELPMEITDQESTSNPLDAIWQAYQTFLNNSGNSTPGYILLSARECYKTLSISILEILLLLHFSIDICHAAAIESQSSVALQYISSFILAIEPLLTAAGWIATSNNKRLIKYTTPEGKQPWIKVIVCTPQGMNSSHASLLVLDELDLVSEAALKEGRNIVGYSRGIYGITIYLSTRKYNSGLMHKAIESAASMNYKILRWNILDVTEKCPASRHLPDEPKEDRYVAKNLPLTTLDFAQWDSMADSEKIQYDMLPKVHKGCQSCLLLPICRTKLADKPSDAVGGFYKPISAVMQKFRENDAETAEAQLLCWRPGSLGMVYPRFSTTPGKGNVISVRDVYEKIMGPTNKPNISEMELLDQMHRLEIPFYAGVDWGFTHDSVILVCAILPTGEIIIFDCFAAPGLEFSDVLSTAISYRDKYKMAKWFCDQAMPSSIKSFNKNGMKSPAFKKDVLGGIDAVRSKIIDATGKRQLFVMETPNTKKVITAIMKHSFLLDGQGNPTLQPGDERGVADICDSLRYLGQNLWPVKGTRRIGHSWTDMTSPAEQVSQNPHNTELMKREIAKLVGPGTENKGGSQKKGGFKWNI